MLKFKRGCIFYRYITTPCIQYFTLQHETNKGVGGVKNGLQNFYIFVEDRNRKEIIVEHRVQNCREFCSGFI